MAHLLAPLLFGVGAHGAGKCVPGAPGPGREAGEPDAEPARGDVGLGSQPPRHKDKLPNRSTTACWHGKAVVRGTTRVRPALLDCLRHRWCCHTGWVRLPTAEGVPRANGGAPGRRECFPAQGATGASCTGCGATARVDEGAQRAPHPNGLSVDWGGGQFAEAKLLGDISKARKAPESRGLGLSSRRAFLCGGPSHKYAPKGGVDSPDSEAHKGSGSARPLRSSAMAQEEGRAHACRATRADSQVLGSPWSPPMPAPVVPRRSAVTPCGGGGGGLDRGWSVWK